VHQSPLSPLERHSLGAGGVRVIANLPYFAVARQLVLFFAAKHGATPQQRDHMLAVTKRAIELNHNGLRASEFGKAAFYAPNLIVFPFCNRLNKPSRFNDVTPPPSAA
jgi:hypothetical protein